MTSHLAVSLIGAPTDVGAGVRGASMGPEALRVADLAQVLQSPNPVLADFFAAAQQAGHPLNPDFNGAQQEGVGAYQVTHRDGERFSAAKAYLTPHLGRPNLQVFTDALVTRVLTARDDGGPLRADGIEFRGQGGRGPLQTLRLNPGGEVLLSAGAFGSPQLLMLSGIGPAEHLAEHGIAVQHDLPGVGANLHDHIDAVMVVRAPRLTELFGLSAKGAWHLARGAWQWKRERTGPLTTNFAEAGGFIKSDPGEPIPDLQLHFVVGQLVDHGRQTVWGHGYSCHVCLLRPRSRGTLRLASPDPQVAPLIDPAFLQDPDDVARLARGFQHMRHLLGQSALARHGGRETAPSADAQTPEQIEQFLRRHADTIYHPVGTCQMGPGPEAVVDARLRVHGVAGLRVVDASVMPRVVGGNTNAPVIMVAEKAVDMILDDRRAAA